MKINIPGGGTLNIDYVIMDFNGTIAVDGVLKESVKTRINRLAEKFKVYVITSDTQGTAERELEGLPVTLEIYNTLDAGKCKREATDRLGGEFCACIGNGRNDLLMFESAALSIAVLETEGLYAPLIKEADLLVKTSEDALDLLLDAKRLISGLRT
jgi:soluble P-type ATPase